MGSRKKKKSTPIEYRAFGYWMAQTQTFNNVGPLAICLIRIENYADGGVKKVTKFFQNRKITYDSHELVITDWKPINPNRYEALPLPNLIPFLIKKFRL